MERRNIDLDQQDFILINGPLIFLNLTANIFYAFCLFFPPHSRQRLKQPSRIPLEFLIWCSIIYSVSLALMHWMLKENKSIEMFAVSYTIVLYYVHNSMMCSVWLNFCYYIQIVPPQRALLIWVKRNIRSVICVALLYDAMFFLFSSAVILAETIISIEFADINGTWAEPPFDELHFTSQVCSFAIKAHISIYLCVMMVSSFSTVHYLHRHIKRVIHSGSSFSTPRIQSQMRVTVTGICQGVLYLLYTFFHLFDSLTYNFSPNFALSAWVCFTASSLYISGTTVNLGISQTTFRQRAADVWKALKALCGVGMVTNDVKVHSIQLTLGEIANTVTTDVQMPL